MSLSPSSSAASQPVRIGNFYSSFDTQAVIQQLTAAAEVPINQISQQESGIQQKQNAISQLQTEFAALLSRANTLMDPNSVSAKTATVFGTGVSAAASAAATPGSFSVAVTQIATGTTATGSALTAPLNATALLNASNVGTAVTAGTFTIQTPQGAATITVDPATQSLNDVIAAINAQTTTTGVTASIVNDANGQPNLLHLTSTGGAIQLGSGADTSNFLAATNLLASPGTTTRDSTLDVNRINLGTAMSAASFAGGAPASGPHWFSINGVHINYDASVDSLSAVITRINGSSAGVKAAYDPISDKITLTQTKPGSVGIQLADDGAGGNFLARTGLLAATQALGQNAQYSINNGPAQYATSNTVTLGNGVTLTLTAPTGATPATVTVGQDSSAAVTAITNFVSDYNTLATDLAAVTKSDQTNPGPMSGDSNLISLQSQLRAIMTDVGTNVTGQFSQLDSIGLSFGAIGSAVGTTNTLVFDQNVFQAAMTNNPASVQNALSQFTVGATLVPGGTSSITGISGTYAGTIPGNYAITSDASGLLTSVFTPSDGSAAVTQTATVAANGTNTTLLPGITLNIGALQSGTTSISAGITNESVIGKMRDFLNSLAGPGGTLPSLQDEYSNDIKDMEARKAEMQSSVNAQVAIWQQKFTAMEQAMAKASSVMSQLNQAMGTTTTSSSTTKPA